MLRWYELRFGNTIVGGMRGERNKWNSLFEHVTLVIYTFNASSFGQILYEDDAINRIHETLCIWESLVNGFRVPNVKLLVVFTFVDVLQLLLAKKSFASVFPGYKGRMYFIKLMQFAANVVQPVLKFLQQRCTKVITTDPSRVGFCQLNLHDNVACNDFNMFCTDLICNPKEMSKEIVAFPRLPPAFNVYCMMKSFCDVQIHFK